MALVLPVYITYYIMGFFLKLTVLRFCQTDNYYYVKKNSWIRTHYEIMTDNVHLYICIWFL